MQMLKIIQKSLLFLFLGFSWLLQTTTAAQESYLQQLHPGSRSSFKHWNTKRSEITGYSHVKYSLSEKQGKKFIIEKNENTKADGQVFTRKTLWFAADSGIPVSYVEEDLRKNFSITNSYRHNKIHTRLDKQGEILEFETDLKDEKGVPFEVVIFYLRKNYTRILQSKDYVFTLFLPMLAIELEEKGLPRSMSMIQMRIEAKKKIMLETPYGKKTAQQLVVFPESAMLRALLPRKKTHFVFTFGVEKPHQLLQFEEGETRHLLTRLETQ